MQRVRVGVIGCGEIAQWMHIPFLQELPGFEVTALCDVSRRVVDVIGQRFGVDACFIDYHRMLEQAPIDAVVVATPIHAEPVIAAAKAGKHILVEKPMAFNIPEAEAMVDAAEHAGVVLMVAYMKRYDPGYIKGRSLMQAMDGVRMIRVHDFNGPNEAYVRDVTTTIRDEEADARNRVEWAKDVRRRSEIAIGQGHPDGVYRAYGLLGGLASHDISILRGAFGSPRGVAHTDIWDRGNYILSTLDYGDDRRCVFEIGTTRKKDFDEELAAFGLHGTVRIRFPSPYVKYAPTLVLTTTQDGDAVVHSTITTSYEEAFRRELEHFHDCIVTGRTPETPGSEGIEDVRLQIEITQAALRGG